MKIVSVIILSLLLTCSKKSNFSSQKVDLPPIVKESGKYIEFPVGSSQINLFKTTEVTFLNYDLTINAPGTVIGKVVKAGSIGNPPVVLFATKELSTAYTNYIQDAKQIAFAKSIIGLKISTNMEQLQEKNSTMLLQNYLTNKLS